MLKLSPKQREAGFERIKDRFPKQRVQSWMPERLNTKPLGRERTRETQELRQAGDWTKAQCSNKIWWYKGEEDRHVWEQQLRGGSLEQEFGTIRKIQRALPFPVQFNGVTRHPCDLLPGCWRHLNLRMSLPICYEIIAGSRQKSTQKFLIKGMYGTFQSSYTYLTQRKSSETQTCNTPVQQMDVCTETWQVTQPVNATCGRRYCFTTGWWQHDGFIHTKFWSIAIFLSLNTFLSTLSQQYGLISHRTSAATCCH